MTAPRTPQTALGEVARALPSWLTEGEPVELPPARDGYQFWECYSVDQMEGFTRIAGVTRETVEFLRDQILRKIVRAERNGGIPLRHYRMRWESEAYAFAAAERMGLTFNAHALNTHLTVAAILQRGAQRRARYAQYSQVPELTITEKALQRPEHAR